MKESSIIQLKPLVSKIVFNKSSSCIPASPCCCLWRSLPVLLPHPEQLSLLLQWKSCRPSIEAALLAWLPGQTPLYLPRAGPAWLPATCLHAQGRLRNTESVKVETVETLNLRETSNRDTDRQRDRQIELMAWFALGVEGLFGSRDILGCVRNTCVTYGNTMPRRQHLQHSI